MDIQDEFRLSGFVENEPEVQLVAEKIGPRIRPRASQENEVVIGSQTKKLNLPCGMYVDLSCIGLG